MSSIGPDEISSIPPYTLTSTKGKTYLQLNIASSEEIQKSTDKASSLVQRCKLRYWEAQKTTGAYHNFCIYCGYRKPVKIQTDTGPIIVYVRAKDIEKLGFKLDGQDANQFHQTLSKTASYMQSIPLDFWITSLSSKKTIVEHVGSIGRQLESLAEGQIASLTSGESPLKHSKVDENSKKTSKWKWDCLSGRSSKVAEKPLDILIEKKGAKITAQKISGIIGEGAFAEVRGAGEYAIRIPNPLKLQSQAAIDAAATAQHNLEKMHHFRNGRARGIEPVPKTISHFNASTGEISATQVTVTARALGDLYDLTIDPKKQKMSLSIDQKQRCARDITEGFLTMHECNILNVDIKSKNILLVGSRDAQGNIQHVEGALCSDWDEAVDMDKHDSISGSTPENVLSEDNDKWNILNSAKSLIDQAAQEPAMKEFTLDWLKKNSLTDRATSLDNYDQILLDVQTAYKEQLNKISIFQIGLILYELYTGNSAVEAHDENGYISQLSFVSDVLSSQEGLSPPQKELISKMLDKNPVNRPSFSEIANAFT